MNQHLSITYNPEAEADQLHALLKMATTVRASAAGGWVEDCLDDFIHTLKEAIENEADERADTIAANYADWRHDQAEWNGVAF